MPGLMLRRRQRMGVEPLTIGCTARCGVCRLSARPFAAEQVLALASRIRRDAE